MAHSKLRTNRLILFAQLAFKCAKRELPRYAHRYAPKIYTQPQLLACLLLKEYLRLDYRSICELLAVSDGLRLALNLTRVPEFSTLWYFNQRKIKPELIEQLLSGIVCDFVENRAPGRPCRTMALDSTGLFLHQTSRYYAWRAKLGRGQRG